MDELLVFFHLDTYGSTFNQVYERIQNYTETFPDDLEGITRERLQEILDSLVEKGRIVEE